MLFQWQIRSGVGQCTLRRLRTAFVTILFIVAGLSAAAEETNWTVLTVARNGNWGIASERTRSEAIAGALGRCQAMTPEESDCGAELVAFRSGSGLALLCGDHRVIVTGNDPEAAGSAAFARLIVLRELYGPGFPACLHLLRIDSNGALATFKARRLSPSNFDGIDCVDSCDATRDPT
jgi:hypothetical protein